jgi:uncharacterized Zn-finger protein
MDISLPLALAKVKSALDPAACRRGAGLLAACDMTNPPQAAAPETVLTNSARVRCDGATDIRGGAALGHPRVWLEIDARGWAECGYCDRRFVLKGGPADVL